MDKYKCDNLLMDTKLIVSDLLATDLSQQQLADLIPCSQSLIAAYANGHRGKRPTMLIGNRLIELHKQRCKKTKQSIPPSQQKREADPGTRAVAPSAEGMK